MKHLLAFLAGALASAPLCAVEVQGNHIILDESEMLMCALDGGCSVVTNNALRDAIANEVARALAACRNKT